MGVRLREKKMRDGRISFYLDIYHNKDRWYEFLDIHINKNRPDENDKGKKRLANEIRIKRENELIVQDNGLIDKSKRKADFVLWFAKYLEGKGNNNTHKAVLAKIQKYNGKKQLSFTSITPEWINGFSKHLQIDLANNTAKLYLANVFTALEDAVRQDIISLNPFRKIPRHERIKAQSVYRQAFSFEQLQNLIDTPCKINPQYKQAYLFSCFTGLRWSDVNPLRWSEIVIKKIKGIEEWFIYFEQEKTEDIEYLPLSDGAVEILKERKKEALENQERSFFVFPDVKEYDEKYKSGYKTVSYNLKKWAELAGIDPKLMHFHTGRHTFATNVLENSPDADLWTVSKLLGHKSIMATQIYAHVRDSRKKSAVKGLPKLNMKLKSKAA
jgi:integrase